jgi:predicted Fe-Mo cluster-binding NifX family protein
VAKIQNINYMDKIKNKNISNGIKIAISSTGENLTDNVSEIFARCPFFIIAEIKDQKIERIEVLENKSTDQMSGAGISAAQLMAEKNVNAVITGNVGPRALDVLKQFNIEIYTGSGAIKKVLQEFINGKLKKIEK